MASKVHTINNHSCICHVSFSPFGAVTCTYYFLFKLFFRLIKYSFIVCLSLGIFSVLIYFSSRLALSLWALS